MQSLFGKMMATHEDLEAAAAAYMEKYLVDNSIYNTKQDRGADGVDAIVSRDQEDDIELGAAGRATSTASVGSKVSATGRKGWFGGHVDEDGQELQKTAGWFKQCRCVSKSVGVQAKRWSVQSWQQSLWGRSCSTATKELVTSCSLSSIFARVIFRCAGK
jgi:hypothetical protein